MPHLDHTERFVLRSVAKHNLPTARHTCRNAAAVYGKRGAVRNASEDKGGGGRSEMTTCIYELGLHYEQMRFVNLPVPANIA